MTTPTAPPPTPTDAERRLNASIDYWKRSLLDLTHRNRALNFKPARVSTIVIVDEQPAEVFRELCLNRGSMKFKPAPEPGDNATAPAGSAESAPPASGTSGLALVSSTAPTAPADPAPKATPAVASAGVAPSQPTATAQPSGPAPLPIDISQPLSSSPAATPTATTAALAATPPIDDEPSQPSAEIQPSDAALPLAVSQPAASATPCVADTPPVAATAAVAVTAPATTEPAPPQPPEPSANAITNYQLPITPPPPSVSEAAADLLLDEADTGPALDYVPYDRQTLDARQTDDMLQTSSTPEQLDRSLRRIDEQTRLAIEEQGVNTLFFSLGMLHYTEDAQSREVFRAPLVLVPAALARKSARSGYAVTATDDDPLVNPALVEFLRRFHDITLPDLPDSANLADSYDLQSFFQAAREAIAGKAGWSVKTELYL